jgi:hypothetical protein
MPLAMATDWMTALASIAVFLLCPILFLVGTWSVDRQFRRRHRSATIRWFALAGFATVVLALRRSYSRADAVAVLQRQRNFGRNQLRIWPRMVEYSSARSSVYSPRHIRRHYFTFRSSAPFDYHG